jgi:MmpS family membrane protein
VTQYAPNPPQQAPAKPSNGLGLAGFIVGLIGLLLSFIPIIGMVAWPLVILGIVFSAVGIAKASKGRATNKGLSIAGLIVSVIGLIVCILWVAVWNKAVDEVNEEINAEVPIVYEVTGDATGVSITYMEFTNGDDVASKDETADTLPWKKETSAANYVKDGGAVIVSTGEAGGSVTCKMTVDGKVVAEETISGQFAVATCENL